MSHTKHLGAQQPPAGQQLLPSAQEPVYICLSAAHSNEYSRTTLSLPATARCVRQASTLCMPTGRAGPPCSSTRWGRAGDGSCAVQQAGPRHAHLHGTRSNLLRSVTTPTNCSNNTESLVHAAHRHNPAPTSASTSAAAGLSKLGAKLPCSVSVGRAAPTKSWQFHSRTHPLWSAVSRRQSGSSFRP